MPMPCHVNEYVSLDAEIGFVLDHCTVMATPIQSLGGMAAAMEAQHGAPMHPGRASADDPEPIPSIHVADAQALIACGTGEDPHGKLDLVEQTGQTDDGLKMSDHFLFVGRKQARPASRIATNDRRPQHTTQRGATWRVHMRTHPSQRLHIHALDDHRGRRKGLMAEVSTSPMVAVRCTMGADRLHRRSL
jgi:nondiscriminating aspartyl-tRNA synthetase